MHEREHREPSAEAFLRSDRRDPPCSHAEVRALVGLVIGGAMGFRSSTEAQGQNLRERV